MTSFFIHFIELYWTVRVFSSCPKLAQHTNTMVAVYTVLISAAINGPSMSSHTLQTLAKMMMAYYAVDTSIFVFARRQPSRYVFITHHIAAMKLIRLTLRGILPIQNMARLALLFDLSNAILIPYQLCREKGWMRAADALALPFAITYIPIRLVAIPVYTAYTLVPFLLEMHDMRWKYYCSAIIAFLNAFSMYYAVHVARRFHDIYI